MVCSPRTRNRSFVLGEQGFINFALFGGSMRMGLGTDFELKNTVTVEKNYLSEFLTETVDGRTTELSICIDVDC
jgi:hypothetical protein